MVARTRKRVAVCFTGLITVVCLLSANHSVKRQRQLIEQIRNRGGRVCFDYHFVGPDQTFDPDLPPTVPRWLQNTLGHFMILSRVVDVDLRPMLANKGVLDSLHFFPKLKHLQIGPQVSDRELRHLRHVNQLETLCLIGPRITDEDLAYLSEMTQLAYLRLENTNVSGVGLQHVAKVPSLIYLNLSHSPVDDLGMKAVGELRHLETLDLTGTRVTDRGLEELANLSKLRMLYLLGTDVSSEGIAFLNEHCPDCHVVTFKESVE